MDLKLAGKIAVVTGAARGIGKGIAETLAAEGAAIALVDIANLDQAEATRRAIEGSGGRAIVVEADVTRLDSVESMARRVGEALGDIAVLVNNAGIVSRQPILEDSVENWDRVLRTNLYGCFHCCRAIAPGMVARGAGKIVNICSLMSEVGRPGIAPYTAAKGGLKLLTRALCAELGPHNIQVNGIGPGYIATDLTADLRADAGFDAWVRQRAPAGRWGTTDDLVGALLFLVSAASDYVNGQIVYVDGGMLATI